MTKAVGSFRTLVRTARLFVQVGISSLGLERFANEQGQLALPDFAVGTYQMRVRQLGYIPADVQLIVAPNIINDVVVHMTRIAQQLDAMNVSTDWRAMHPGGRKMRVRRRCKCSSNSNGMPIACACCNESFRSPDIEGSVFLDTARYMP